MHIEKEQLVNLAYSLQREYLATNALGSYAQSTLANCATRKYHGLLVVQQPQIDHEWHVLLHSIDETIVQKDYEFNLALRRYEGANYEPRGHKYLVDFTSVPVPTFTYRVADCIIKKEIVLANDENRVLIRYTVLDAPQPLNLILRPFLSFRGRHGLSAANTYINKKYTPCDSGATWQLYEKYDKLHLQTSRKADYTAVPDWYYKVEYTREIERGYAATEDLFAPGAFEVSLKKGDVLVVAAGTTEAKSSNLKKQFEQALARFPKTVDTPQAALQRAANQFIIATPTEANIVAGYPWFGTWGRDTFVSTAGLLTATGQPELFDKIMATQLANLKNGLFHNTNGSYNSVDAPLWFVNAIQQRTREPFADLFRKANLPFSAAMMWEQYGAPIRHILDNFRQGTHYNIVMHSNGLISQGADGIALTWMDAIDGNEAVTPRRGYAVEINALWYNAVCFALEAARAANDTDFIAAYAELPTLIKASFVDQFWDNSRNYLADVILDGHRDFAVRPNMVFAVSLPYSMLSLEQQQGVVEHIKKELLTPFGLRSLSPKHSDYKGHIVGSQAVRDRAYHNGTVWVWLSAAFAEAYLKVYERSGEHFIKTWYEGFAPLFSAYGIGTLPEILDGDPPHAPRGANAQAWSTAELVRLAGM